MTPEVTFADIEAARERLVDDSVVKRTPVERSTSLDAMTGGEVHLKMEHLQWTGSFKPRGAYNKIAQCVDAGGTGDGGASDGGGADEAGADEAGADEVGVDAAGADAAGAGSSGVDHVVAASAGNHAQGVALAATTLGVESTIVMPRNAPQTKVDATRGYGATVELVGKDFQEAMRHAQGLVEEPSTAFVHAYDDPAIVAGQGTLGLEIHDDLPGVDTVVVPIGGGGLVGGVATALAGCSPDTRVIGVQAEGAATVHESLDKGRPETLDSVQTIADGIATGGLSELTLGLIREHVDEVVTVTDGEIARAVLLLLERAKQVVEGAGAAPIAAILSDDVDVSGETVMPVLSGGNLDMTMLQTVLVHALTDREQLLRLQVRIDDTPGKMADISGIIAEHNGNIQTIRHDRSAAELDVGEAYLVFQIETAGAGHARNVIRSIRDAGYEVRHVNA